MPRKPPPRYAGRTQEQVVEHIKANVVVDENGCWIWQRSRTVHGDYPMLRWRGICPGHRVSYAAFREPIPEGLAVLHTCDNPPCCNPDHLFVGTLADNNADMDAKGRANRSGLALGRVIYGEKHHRAKLTDAQAREIKSSKDRGVDLARRYGVSQQTVSNIRNARRRVERP